MGSPWFFGRCGGSSPRMRGTLAGLRQQDRHRRFIPAYAGNTAWRRNFLLQSSVHPRVCGEHIEMAIQSDGGRGSSPRMRGTLFLEAGEIIHEFLRAKVYRFFEPGKAVFSGHDDTRSRPGKLSLRRPVPRGRCGRHIRYNRRHSGERPRWRVPERGSTARRENAGRG